MLCNSFTSKSRSVDKDRGRPVGACELSLRTLTVNVKSVTFEFGRLQNDDGVMDRCRIFAEN